MQTLITDSPREAADFINRGQIVAFPTETVYGLGADITNDDAVQRIFQAKGRPGDNPLIVHVYSPKEVEKVAASIPETARKLMDRFFPGPLTLVLCKQSRISPLVTAGLPTVGVRCPQHPVTRAFLRECRHPVAAPSANLSGKPSSTDWKSVHEDLNGKINCILRGEQSAIGLESTIVDCATEPPRLLRAGAISLDELRAVVPGLLGPAAIEEHAQPKSPGLKYPHYAPSAEIRLCGEEYGACEGGKGTAWIGLSPPPEGAAVTCRCDDAGEYAHRLFRFFRECDREHIRTIFCEMPPPEGIGQALRDRLRRAAEGK